MIKYIEFWLASDVAAVLWFVAIIASIAAAYGLLVLFLKAHAWLLKFKEDINSLSKH